MILPPAFLVLALAAGDRSGHGEIAKPYDPRDYTEVERERWRAVTLKRQFLEAEEPENV